MKLKIENKFTSQLPADPIFANTRRQVTKACFSFVNPKQTAKPKLVHVSPEMLQNLNLTETDSTTEEFLNLFTGNVVLPNSKPYAMCYGGHQFGSWAGQLNSIRTTSRSLPTLQAL